MIDFVEILLKIAKDLDSGDMHWSVQSVDVDPRPSTVPHDQETVPRAFQDPKILQETRPNESMLPFLMENLDTRQTRVMMAELQEQRDSSKSPASSPRGQVRNDDPGFWIQTRQQQAMRRFHVRNPTGSFDR